MSIIKKKYDEGGTQLNKLKFAPSMGSGHPGKPPLKDRTIPIENTSGPDYRESRERADDITRITKLFTRKEGLGFLANQAILKGTGNLLGKLGINNSPYSIAETTKLRSTIGGFLASSIAQTTVSGTGVHLVAGRLFGKPNTNFNNISDTTKAIGQPGSVKVTYYKDSILANAPFDYGEDKVNRAYPYSRTEVDGNVDDYIKFYFEVLTPGETNNTFIHFRAFLDSFDDNYTSTWNPVNYVGRGEQFYSYQNFNRTVSVNFKSAVATKTELTPVYQKLVYLASTTAPTYSDNGLMRGTVVKLNIGDYLSDTPGFLTSVTYGWESRYPFEIAYGKKLNLEDGVRVRGGNTDDTVQELPHILNCSFTFTPIHTFTPQTGLYHYITNPTGDSSQFFPVTPPDYKSRNAALNSELKKKAPAYQPNPNVNYEGVT